MLLRLFKSLCCFLLLGHISYGQVQHPEDVLSEINANISAQQAEKNLAKYEALLAGGFFDTLTCTVSGPILHKIGVSLYFLDRNQEAADFYMDEVLPLWEACPDKEVSAYANSLYNTGVSLQYADNYYEARPYFYKGLQLFESDSLYSKIKLSTKYAGTARFYKDAQAYVRAEDYYKNAIQIVQAVGGNSSRLAGYFQDLAITQNDMGRYELALDNFKSAISLFSELDDTRRLGMAYHNIAVSYLELDSLGKAETYARSAAALHTENLSFLSNDYEILGLVAARRGQRREAKELLDESLALRKKFPGNARALSSSYENLAELYKSHQPAAALTYIDSSIRALVINPEINALGNPRVRKVVTLNDVSFIRALGIKAQILTDTLPSDVQLRTALDIYDKIDSLLSKNLFNLHFEKSRLTYLELLYDHYTDAIELCVEQHQLHPSGGYDRLAFSYSTRIKAIVLLSEIREREWYQQRGKSELEDRRVKAQRLLRQRYTAVLTHEDSTALISEYLTAQRELEFLLDSIERVHVASTRKASSFDLEHILSVERVQEQLDHDELYIEYAVGKEGLYSFWITHDDFRLIEDRDIGIIQRLSEQLDLAIRNTAPQAELDILRQSLTSHLIAWDELSHLTDKTSWIIVPDAFLQRLSFDVLSSPREEIDYLIEQVALTTVYSGHMFFDNDQRKIGTDYLGFGTSYSASLGQNGGIRQVMDDVDFLTRLPEAEREIEQCRDIMKGRAFLGQEATKAPFLEQWSKADIVHLALHGYVDKDFYERSCLFFDDRGEDNMLYLPELEADRSESDLVVLSACYTAEGQLYKGEGLRGLTKSFAKSGRTSVISSLWQASDVSSTRIIPDFFRSLKSGDDLAEALRQAKLKYIKEMPPSQRHPNYWANFQLIGNGNRTLAKSWWGMYLLTGALGLVLFGLLLSKLKSRGA